MTLTPRQREFSFCEVSLPSGPSGALRTRIVDVVLDLDYDGNVLGIEELFELESSVPELKLSNAVDAGCTLSIDHDAGAFYLRMEDSRSTDQVSARAAVTSAADGTIISIRLFDFAM